MGICCQKGPRLNIVVNVVVVAMVKPMHIAGSTKLIQSVKYEGSIWSTYDVEGVAVMVIA